MTITLEQAAVRLKKTFNFTYLTYDRLGGTERMTLWTRLPYKRTPPKFSSMTKTWLSDACHYSVTILPPALKWEVDLSEYRQDGEVDFSRCLVRAR